MRLFIDFDNTIVNSTKRIVDILNKRYGLDVDYKEVMKYDLSDKFQINQTEILNIFASKEFFDGLEDYIFSDCVDILSELASQMETILVSISGTHNMFGKNVFLDKYLPFIAKRLFLRGLDDKSTINMEHGILLDDVSKYLLTSNATVKLLYADEGIKREWNKEYPMIKSYKELRTRINTMSYYLNM